MNLVSIPFWNGSLSRGWSSPGVFCDSYTVISKNPSFEASWLYLMFRADTRDPMLIFVLFLWFESFLETALTSPPMARFCLSPIAGSDLTWYESDPTLEGKYSMMRSQHEDTFGHIWGNRGLLGGVILRLCLESWWNFSESTSQGSMAAFSCWEYTSGNRHKTHKGKYMTKPSRTYQMGLHPGNILETMTRLESSSRHCVTDHLQQRGGVNYNVISGAGNS